MFGHLLEISNYTRRLGWYMYFQEIPSFCVQGVLIGGIYLFISGEPLKLGQSVMCMIQMRADQSGAGSEGTRVINVTLAANDTNTKQVRFKAYFFVYPDKCQVIFAKILYSACWSTYIKLCPTHTFQVKNNLPAWIKLLTTFLRVYIFQPVSSFYSGCFQGLKTPFWSIHSTRPQL